MSAEPMIASYARLLVLGLVSRATTDVSAETKSANVLVRLLVANFPQMFLEGF